MIYLQLEYFVTHPLYLVFVSLSVKSMPHYEQGTNVAFVIMSLSNVTVMYKCVCNMDGDNTLHALFGYLF